MARMCKSEAPQERAGPRTSCSSCLQLLDTPLGSGDSWHRLGSQHFSINKETRREMATRTKYSPRFLTKSWSATLSFVVLHQVERSTGSLSGETGHKNCNTSMNYHCWIPSTQYFYHTLGANFCHELENYFMQSNAYKAALLLALVTTTLYLYSEASGFWESVLQPPENLQL